MQKFIRRPVKRGKDVGAPSGKVGLLFDFIQSRSQGKGEGATNEEQLAWAMTEPQMNTDDVDEETMKKRLNSLRSQLLARDWIHRARSRLWKARILRVAVSADVVEPVDVDMAVNDESVGNGNADAVDDFVEGTSEEEEFSEQPNEQLSTDELERRVRDFVDKAYPQQYDEVEISDKVWGTTSLDQLMPGGSARDEKDGQVFDTIERLVEEEVYAKDADGTIGRGPKWKPR